MMLNDVKVRCENGWIRITWEWAGQDTEGVRIYYKKKEAEKGDGSLFVQEEILPLPHERSGKAERKLWNEWGLYTFTIVPEMTDGTIAEKVVVQDIMLGEPVRVTWEITAQDGHPCVVFAGFTGKIPPGVVCLKDSGYVYQMDYEISRDTVLLFPKNTDMRKLSIFAKEPYNKAYDLQIRR